jgi:hypothetical protein
MIVVLVSMNEKYRTFVSLGLNNINLENIYKTK